MKDSEAGATSGAEERNIEFPHIASTVSGQQTMDADEAETEPDQDSDYSFDLSAESESQHGSGFNAGNAGSLYLTDDSNPSVLEAVLRRRGLERINECVARIGMGTYQWRLMGWFADNMWLQGVSVVIPAIKREFSLPESEMGLGSTFVFLGMMVGSSAWGMLSDVIGRKPAFTMTLFVASLGGFLAAESTSFSQFYTRLFFLGTGVGGNLPVDGSLFIEFVPPSHTHLVTLLSLFWPLGQLATAAIAWNILPQHSCPVDITLPCDIGAGENSGWRITMRLLSIATALMLITRILLFRMLESPKFLLSANRAKEAEKVLVELARINSFDFTGRLVSLDIETDIPLDQEGQNGHTCALESNIIIESGQICPNCLTINDNDQIFSRESVGEPVDNSTFSHEAFINSTDSLLRNHLSRTATATSSLTASNVSSETVIIAVNLPPKPRTWYDGLRMVLQESYESFFTASKIFKSLFEPGNVRLTTLLIFAIWSFISLGYTMFNGFLPLFLSATPDGTSPPISIDETYRNYFIIAIMGIPGSIGGMFLIDTPIGRRGTMAASTFGTALALYLFTFSRTPQFQLFAGCVISVLQNCMYGVLYTYTPEVFESNVRGTAGGAAAALSRVFGLYMIFYAILVAFRDSEVPFYKSPGPVACFQGAVLLIPSAIIARFAFTKTTSSLAVWGIYAAFMAVSLIFMIFKYRQIARMYLKWPASVKVTTIDEILKVYATIVPKPDAHDFEEPWDQQDRKMRLWERNGTEWFAEALQKAVKMPAKAQVSEPAIIRKRLAQWNWERPLMAWFMERSAVNPDTVKRFSREWDALLKQAVEALSKKYQIEKLNRGALLFQLEAPAIIFGFLYFIIAFIDKWVIVIATGKVGVFIANVSNLNLGITFATIFLLLSAGFLELTISSCSERINRFKYANMSTVNKPLDLVVQYQTFTDSLYRTEAQRFAARSFAVFLVVTAIMTVSYGLQDATHSVFWLYGIACASYCGLLVGLFNKMFISINENKLNQLLAGAILISLAVSAAVIRVMKDNSYALIATGLSCWGFAMSCLFIRFSERARSPYYDISIGPTLRTSGQRMIGYESNDYTERQLQLYGKKLENEKGSFKLYLASSPLGLSVLSYMDQIFVKVSTMNRKNMLQTPAHDLEKVLGAATQMFRTGALEVREVPGLLTAGNVSYAAISTKSVDNDALDIFVPGTANVPDIERVVLICEAIVHEVAENLGLSHSSACAMEVLVCSYATGVVSVPQRVLRQLSDSDSFQMDRIISNTQRESTKSSALGIDVDRFWLQFTHAERQWFYAVSLIWNASIRQDTQKNTALFELCVNAPPSVDSKVGDLLNLTSEKNSLWYICCHALLIGNLARNISDRIANHEELQPFNFPKTMLKQPVKKLSDVFNVHLAVAYFALTCDVSFGREVAELSPFVRRLFGGVFWLNQSIFYFTNQFLVFSGDPFIHDFRLQAEHGVSQIHHFQQAKGGNIVQRVDVFEGGQKKTSIIAPSSSIPHDIADSTNRFLEIKRYAGSKPDNWEPTNADQPFAIAVVQSLKNFSRVLQERFFDENQKVNRSHLYTFEGKSSRFPNSRLVFSHDIPASPVNTMPSEIHWFHVEGPMLGLVKGAVLNRIHKVTRQFVKILVEFDYEKQSDRKAPKWGVFRRDDLPGWEAMVEYAPYSDPGVPMQPWSVRYSDGSGGSNKVIVFDYSHPKHVTTKTILTRAKSKSHLDDYFGIFNIIPLASIQDSCELTTINLKPRKRYAMLKNWPFIHVNSIEFCAAPYATRERRDILWTAWRAGKIPGVFARYFDQQILYRETALKSYWSYRLAGNLEKAREALRDKRRLLSNVLYIADIPAKRTRLQIRYSDLAIFGNGGDSENISSFDSGEGEGLEDGPEILQAICLDSGTWPTGGGGVGSCRRDVIDSLSRVRWTAIAEIAGAELEHKDYQIEKNINAIIYLPIFDNDMGSPMENIYKTLPFGDLRVREVRTTDKVVRTKFVPIIVELIHACLTENLDTRRVHQDEQLILSFYEYFKLHDWRKSWDHPLTQRAWMTTLLEKAKEMEIAGTLLKHESPTLSHISILFTLFSRLLLILSKEIPNVPVVHVSHHGTQSLIAVVAKACHGSSVIIWDHGMLWRERLFALGRDQMPSFTQIGFIGLTRLCTRLAYYRADYVTPCTNVQNVMWAEYLAGGKYLNDFERSSLIAKCSAVLNGTNLKRFNIKRELAMKTPTAVMLSHVSPVKDVMNAIEAARYIVHEFKITDYQLHVYGSLESDAAYSLACNMAIKELNLEANVFLKGLGNATNVLPTGWIFVNSSITEGLPLAIGEAGLCGLPVVCTDVGGSREVVSDLKTGAVYGAVVPPSRPRQLALGQLEVFAMTNGLDSFVDPTRKIMPVVNVIDLLEEGKDALAKRIADPEINALREKLGEMFRHKTMSVFSIARYCREHEQVLWLGELYSRARKYQH
ncbi:hypothetical protein HK100_008491 [Physocladia obscura]|uniref:Major facilitator superfamily (MFS) profile domain-containing protein n=1 Tax=Physocladia obscura TaxID=109957 RepID=A0AAD5XJP4_9FUNG|nr:hypothetical protein HK100_008491 [Physocladia obscura]